jgi:hypothetical protein
MSVSPSGVDFVEVSLTRRRSDEFDDSNLRFGVGFDVTLRGPKVRVPGQHLDVTERPANSRYLPRDIGDESASAAVTRTTVEANVPVPSPEQVDHGLRRHSPRPFTLDQEGAGRHPDCFGILAKVRLLAPRSWESLDRTDPCSLCPPSEWPGLSGPGHR